MSHPPAPTDRTADQQTTLWNGTAGHAWVDAQDLLDRMFQPFEHLLVDSVNSTAARRVLDVGCGAGATTLAVARSLPPAARCVGIDISEPMLAAARARAERENAPAAFICADAQSYPFEPAGFDAIISRFGVMFFDNPVRAFENLRYAATAGAALRLIAWRSAAANPFMTVAERAAAPLLPNLPVRQPDAPGQFAFADRDRVHAILEDSGWRDIEIQPLDVPCTLPERELIPYLTRLGPVGLALQDVPEESRDRVIETVRAAFEPYVHGSEVRYTAACWMLRAANPDAVLPPSISS